MSGSVTATQTEIQAAKAAFEAAVASASEVVAAAKTNLTKLVTAAQADVAAANASLGANPGFVAKAEADVGAVVTAVETVGPGAVKDVEAAVVKTESVLASFTKMDWAGLVAAFTAVAGSVVGVAHYFHIAF